MIQSVDEQGTGLRVVFVKRGDRWGHVICTVEDAGQSHEQLTPRLISIERDDRAGRPGSPPLQNMSIEQRANGAVALLVGMAGNSHWSASVEAIDRERRVIFDVACRLGQTPVQSLTSWYLCNREVRPTDIGLELVLRESKRNMLDIVFGEELTPKLDKMAFALEVRSCTSPTVRWKYEISLRTP